MVLKRLLLIVTLALAVLAPGATALARKGRPGPGAGAKADKREQVREKIRQYRNAKLAEILNLDEATAKKLFAVLDRYDDKILPLRVELGQARRELKRMVDSGQIDETRANTLMDTIVEKRAAIEKLERERFAEVRKVLPAKITAKIVVYLPEIERAIEAEIRKAMKKRGLGGGPGGPDSDDDQD